MNTLARRIGERLRADRDLVERLDLTRRAGRVTRSVGLAIESRGPKVAVGEECRLEGASGELLSLVEVVGFEGSRVYSMPVDPVRGLRHADRIVATGRHPRVGVGDALLGRVLDGDGRPLDGGGELVVTRSAPIHDTPVPALDRPRITEPMATGVRSIDGFLTLGRGQRIGIFAGAGVGKSRLLGSIARHAEDEVVVISLVGERNREVREFVEAELGAEGRRRAVVFVATSDESPLRRVRCALAATTVAEDFRRRGRNVTLLMDSLTRVAMALREIGLATGEPPSSKGYTPSVFAFLPRLLERAGRDPSGGALTGIYTVFVEGDDLADPVADASRAILDGHIVLSRTLAERAHYPAVDVLASTSRVMSEVVNDEHKRLALHIRRLMAVYRDHEDLVAIGAYRSGVDPMLDEAVRRRQAIIDLLQQDLHRPSSLEETLGSMRAIVEAEAESAP
ncbi:MAG: FliI/YscN family ATPase [Acidobacteriota bacterium]|nr:FliI/YscN family ATPase [Acidobacteriota bacterium]